MALGGSVSLFRRILVATDFSAAGHAAVARAGQLAAQYQCQLTVLHATPDWTLFSQRASAHLEHYAEITRNADERMRGELEWLRSEYHLTQVRAEVYRGRATLGVMWLVELIQPDLVIAGAGGEHILPGGATVLGGTALKLISRVTMPLLLVRNEMPQPYQTTLAAVAGDSGPAARVAHWAVALAGSGICHIVRAYEAPYLLRMQLCGFHAEALDEAIEEQRRLAQQECDALVRSAQPPTRLEIHLVNGAPVPSVLAQVVVCAPQLMVVGQHQHHTDEHVAAWAAGLGTRLAYHCSTDVLMVP